MEVERTWMTNYPKRDLGNAFMICGVMYAVNSHVSVPTYIRYIFNTLTNQERFLEPGVMPFANFAHTIKYDEDDQKVTLNVGYHSRRKDKANMSMLSYDFRTSKINAWNNGRIESYPVFFAGNT